MKGMNICKCVGQWKCQPLIAEGQLIWKEFGLDSGRFYSTTGPDQRQGHSVMRTYWLASNNESITLAMKATIQPQGKFELATWMGSDKFTLVDKGEFCKLYFPEAHVQYYGHKMRFEVDVDLKTLAKLGWTMESRLIRLS